MCRGWGLLAGARWGSWAFDPGAKLFERTLGDELAAVNDGDVGAEALDDLEHVGGEKDGRAAGDHALQHGFEGACGDGIDAFEWLVEEEDFRTVDDGGGEGEFLLHAVGEVGDEFFLLAGEAHELEQLLGALEGCGAIEAVHLAYEAEVLGRGETAEERHALGNDADVALELGGVCGEVLAENADAAGGGCEQAGEHFDGGGFARAVGAQEAEELSGGYGEIDILNCSKFAEAASERGRFDGQGHGG